MSLVYLIAAILITVITVIDWVGLNRWSRVTGVVLAVVFFLSVNFHSL
jgi:type IV secretory pathway VirB2 component (pilin)